MRIYLSLICFILIFSAQPILAHSEEAVPTAQEVFAGWANLIGFGMFAGGILFRHWAESATTVRSSSSVLKFLITKIDILGWFLLGIGGMLAVFTWSGITTMPPENVISDPSITVITGTSFGISWIIRMLIWLGIGGIWFILRPRYREAAAVILAISVMLISNLYLHSSEADDSFIYLAIESIRQMSLGLLLTSLLFLASIPKPIIREIFQYTRNIVLILLITSLSLRWETVGSLWAAPYNLHGQIFLIQCFILLPLLIWTLAGRRTQQYFVAGVFLIIATLAAFGLTDAFDPSEGKITWEEYLLTQNPVYDVYQDDEILLQFSLIPGLAGQNELFLVLLDASDGSRINDAEINIEAQNQGSNRVSFDVEPVTEGVYQNLAIDFKRAGEWGMEIQVARPEHESKNINFSILLADSPDPAKSDLERGSLVELGIVIFCFVMSLICITLFGMTMRNEIKRNRVSLSGMQISLLSLSLILLIAGTTVLSSFA